MKGHGKGIILMIMRGVLQGGQVVGMEEMDRLVQVIHLRAGMREMMIVVLEPILVLGSAAQGEDRKT
jgi:hypothetical protein